MRALGRLEILGFRRGGLLFWLGGFLLRRLTPNRSNFRRCFLPFQIGHAPTTLDPYAMLLTHIAFYRMEVGSAQRETERSR